MSYVGGPGFELYVPTEMARHVYLALHAAGADLGLADAGYYALDALRIEAGRRAWGAELGPDETPFEAGTLFAVKLDKPGGFIGRDGAARAPRRSRPPSAWSRSSSTRPTPGPGAARRCSVDGESAGEITSAGWSPKLGACVALGYLRGAAATRAARGHAGRGRRLGRARRRDARGTTPRGCSARRRS